MPGKRADGVFLAKFGVDRELWKAAMAKASTEGRSLSAVIREFLLAYTGGA
jgi:hypothetical protein